VRLVPEGRNALTRLALSLFVLVPFCSTDGQAFTSVVLISVDTLRADHLGCYQASQRGTPNIDALARTGTLFSQVSSLVPLTLPSHVALFTSTYPFVNGVQDNGVPLGRGVVTITGVLRNRGYRTAAFVGGFVLDQRFGLNQGFEVYDSPFDLHKKTATDVGDLKRPGAQVIAAAMRWLEHNATSPFFLFIHLYDLHTPYRLPQDPRLRRGETGYRAELSEVDRVIGDFVRFLGRRDLLNKTLVVFTSDHGEGLGDHGESTHGYFIYQSTLRVPLIIHWPSEERRIKQGRIDEPASVLDIAPTVLDAIDLSQPSQMQGRSLVKPRGAEEIYSESLYARNHFGCAVLRSERVGRYKYIDAPQPELYDLSRDPDELQNLYAEQKPKATALRERLGALRSRLPAAGSARVHAPTPETVNALRSLGYLSGPTSSSRLESGVDPKERIGDFEQFGRANALASAGKVEESNELLEELRNRLPGVLDIRVSLGLNRQRLNEYAPAADEFRLVVERDPLNAQAHFDLGISYFRLHQSEPAIPELEAALALEPWYTRAEELLATIYLQKRDYQTARLHLEHILSIDPDNYTARYNLGVFAAMQEKWSEAQQQVLWALHSDPDSAEAHNMLGSIDLKRGELDQATTEFNEAIHCQPQFVSAHFNLALAFQREGKRDQAANEFRETLKIDPGFEAARTALDHLESDGR
jgi:choline-sulfatase